jgi:hypothetical protein
MKFPTILLAISFTLGRSSENGVRVSHHRVNLSWLTALAKFLFGLRDLLCVRILPAFFSFHVPTYTQGPSGAHRELQYRGCPDPNADGNGELAGFCDFPVFVSGLGIEGLPLPAGQAHAKNDLNTGRLHELQVYRLDQNSNCATAPYVHNGAGNFQPGSNEGFSWQGNFVLLRPAGQISNDPGGLDRDGTGGIWAVKGKVTFSDTAFTMKSYKGKTPVDICAILP